MRKKPTANIDLDDLISETKNNIDNDRSAAHVLLTNIMQEILKDPAHTHSELGLIAAKYLEGLQRSSEQMIKLLSTLSVKVSAAGSGNITAETKDEIFDVLQEEYNKEVIEKKEEKE